MKLNGEIIHGNCLDVMARMPEGRVSMVCADLPYGVTSNAWDVVIPFAKLWKQLLRVCKDNARMVFTATQPFTSRLVASNLKMFRDELIWDKMTGTDWLRANKKPMRSHENIIVFGKNSGTYNPQKTYGHKSWSARDKGGFVSMDNFAASREPGTREGDDSLFPLSVLRIKKLSVSGYNKHPTQKPVSLISWLINTYSNPGDLVLDPTCGSGTTAIASMNTGRRWLCIEQDLRYYGMAKKRISEHAKERHQ